jgi:hypothetical protein
MGFCFNNEIYYQLSKGLLPPEYLEIVANQRILSTKSLIIAPSMYMKIIFETDADYKFYFHIVLNSFLIFNNIKKCIIFIL